LRSNAEPRHDQRVESSLDHVVDELVRYPDVRPYTKFWGTHWRLVELADLGIPIPAARLQAGIDQEVTWLSPKPYNPVSRSGSGLPRSHASMEGNAVYAFSRLGFAHHPSTRRMVEALLAWQWPDGGWNCDRRRTAHRSSFHESVTPALGLAAYARETGDAAARAAAVRTAELLLEHRLFRVHGRGEPVHPSWVKLHYPPYWHYDVLQGLRLLHAVDRLNDDRAGDALGLLEGCRRRDGTFSGSRWSSARQPAVLDRDTYHGMLTRRAQEILEASGR
jgi:hypothetical protein